MISPRMEAALISIGTVANVDPIAKIRSNFAKSPLPVPDNRTLSVS